MDASPADPSSAFPAWLQRACRWLALAGGLVMFSAALLTVYSVASRYFYDSPLIGDTELVQMAVATSIAFFLPWAQMQRANIIVDFFTGGLRPSSRARLDGAGTLLLAAMAGLLGVRGISGGLAVHGNAETSMLMGIPIWWTYALIVPGFLLTALVGLLGARNDWRAAREAGGQ